MNGLFIPEITAEMFRNGCLESIEALMAEGEIYDIDYSPWIPCSERLPEEDGRYLCTYITEFGVCVDFGKFYKGDWFVGRVIAWQPLPEPYKAESPETCKGCLEPCIMYEPDMRGCKKKVTERGE